MINTFIFSPINSDNIILFSIFFCLTVLLKSFLELFRGYWNYLSPNSYLAFLTSGGGNVKPISLWLFRLSIALKIICPLLILFNLIPSISYVLLASALFIELKYYFKYHANLMFLYSIILSGFYFTMTSKNTSILFFPLAIALTTSATYIFTAIHKLNHTFLSGKVILKTLELINNSKRIFFDLWHRENLGNSQFFKNILPFLMAITVIIEFILPVLLFIEKFRPVGIILGILLHLGFTILFPATLLHFSLLTVGSYLAFTYF